MRFYIAAFVVAASTMAVPKAAHAQFRFIQLTGARLAPWFLDRNEKWEYDE